MGQGSERGGSGGALLGATSSDVFGGRVRGDASETTDRDGLQLSGTDKREAGGPADAESAGGFFNREEN